MSISLPTPIPQVPVSDLERAISFYESRFGFTLDWKYEDGIAGVSREESRLFLERVVDEPLHPVRIWLNLASVSEVDALHREWSRAGVPISSAPSRSPGGFTSSPRAMVTGILTAYSMTPRLQPKKGYKIRDRSERNIVRHSF